MPLQFALKLLKTPSVLMLMLFSLNGHAVDTDNDGLPDDWEIENDRNPLVADYQVSAGGKYTCALDDSGVHCWGSNEYIQTNVPALSNPTQISTGPYHTCALDDSDVVCWGRNTSGQTNVPALSNPTQVSSGEHHTCALDSSGVACWGWDYEGQTNVPALSNPTQVSSGYKHTCALDDSGVICWGRDDSGQTTVPALTNPTQVSSGFQYTCALDDSGVHCWGSDEYDQINVPALSNPTQISTGPYHTCALDDSGVICWGFNGFGRTNVPALSNPIQVSLGRSHTCALDDSGVVCWGWNYSGQTDVPGLMIDPDGDDYSSQNGNDVFPFDATEWLDTDLDGVGDNSDAFPMDANESLDTDLDGVGNNADPDDDNNGVADGVDQDPLDPSVGALPAQTQLVSVIGSPVAIVGQVVSVEVGYDVEDDDSSLTGLGLRVHYNSSLLTFDQFAEVLSTDNIASDGPFNDTEDLDNDPSTDKYLMAAWTSLFGSWPGALPETLVAIDFTVTEPADDVEYTSIGFSSSSDAAGYRFVGDSYDLNIVNAIWDFDQSGSADALTDGLLLLRHAFGLRGSMLTNDAVAPDSPLIAAEVELSVDSAYSVADIDENDTVDALTDGLLLLRYLFGLRGEALIADAVSLEGTRTSVADIESHIQNFMPFN